MGPLFKKPDLFWFLIYGSNIAILAGLFSVLFSRLLGRWRAALFAPDGRLHLTVLDVGSGDALLVQTPGGRYLLVDGGPSPSKFSDALERRLPLGGKLDWLVVAASGEEQVAALPPLLLPFEETMCT